MAESDQFRNNMQHFSGELSEVVLPTRKMTHRLETPVQFGGPLNK